MRITTRQILIWGLATLVWQLSLSDTVQATPREPQFRALLVGIAHYDKNGDLETLEGKDSTYSIRAAVPELYTSLEKMAEREFPSKNVRIETLIDYDAGEFNVEEITSMDEVRSDHLDDALEKIVDEAPREEDVIIFYFIGHGIRGPGGHLSLMLTNSDSADDARRYLLSQVMTKFKLSKAKRKMIFIDSCQTIKKSGVNLPPFIIEETDRSRIQTQRVRVFYSTGNGKKSFIDQTRRMGYFSKYLIDGLNGAADGSGEFGKHNAILTDLELIDFVRAAFIDEVKAAESDQQIPDLVGRAGQEMIIYRPRRRPERRAVMVSVMGPGHDKDHSLQAHRDNFHRNLIPALEYQFPTSLVAYRGPRYPFPDDGDQPIDMDEGLGGRKMACRPHLDDVESVKAWILSPSVADSIADNKIDYAVIGEFVRCPESPVELYWRVVELKFADDEEWTIDESQIHVFPEGDKLFSRPLTKLDDEFIEKFYREIANSFGNTVPEIVPKIIYAGCFAKISKEDCHLFDTGFPDDEGYTTTSEYLEMWKQFPEELASEFVGLGMEYHNFNVRYANVHEVLQYCIPYESGRRLELYANANAEYVIDGVLEPKDRRQTRVDAKVNWRHQIEPYDEPEFSMAHREASTVGQELSRRIYTKWPNIETWFANMAEQ